MPIDEYRKQMDEMYRHCKWCKHFDGECCTSGAFFVLVDDDIYNEYNNYEDGHEVSMKVGIDKPDEFYCNLFE